MNVHDDEVADMEFFSDSMRPQPAAKFPLERAYFAVAIGLTVVVLIILCNHGIWRKTSLSKVSDGDSLSTAIAKFRMSISSPHDVFNILVFLRKKLHKNPSVIVAAAEACLTKYLLECLQDLPPDDERVPAVIDLMNELWSNPEARRLDLEEHSEEKYTKSFIGIVKKLSESAKEDAATTVEKPSTFSMFAPRKITYSMYEYKIIMAVGMMAIDLPRVQSAVGDEGGLGVIIDAMDSRRQDPRINKWGCWALMHLTFNHPPNKREVVQRGGIPIVTRILTSFIDREDIVQQALALILNLVADDFQTKISLSDVRQMALTHGIVDITQEAEKRYRGNQNLQRLCKAILDALIKEWS